MSKRDNGLMVSVVLRAVGGAFFFAALGGLLVIAIGSASYSQIPKSNPSGDFGYGVALLYMILAGAALGGIIGLVLVGRLAGTGKLPGLTMTLAILGYAGAGFVWFKYTRVMDQGRASATQVIAQQKEHLDQINIADQKLQEKASKELPGLMGPLLYPGAKSVLVDDPEYTRVTLTVTADLDKIDAYYKDLIFDRQREPLSLKGKATRPGDGKALLMATEHFGRTSYSITFVPASWAGGPSKWPADWRSSMPPPNATSFPDPSVAQPKAAETASSQSVASPADTSVAGVTPAEAAAVAAQWQPIDRSPEIGVAYGSLAYPGSKTNYAATHLPPGSPPMSLVALSTTDPIDKVIAYYRPLVQVSVDKPDQFTGIANRADGVRAFASVRRDGDYTIITLSGG